MVKAVIFDIDGVLIDSFEANLKFFRDLFRSCSRKPPSRNEYAAAFHMSMWDMIRHVTGESDDEVRRIWEAAKTVPRHPELFKVSEGSVEVIANLSEVYKLAVVTSRTKEGVDDAFKASKTREFFDVIVSYKDTERHKPEPDPLLLAAKRLGVKPEECAYIGDAETDRSAAKSAGMRFILYSENSADSHSVSSFVGIQQALENL